ncbi:hypothetical protein JTB14_030774 [Gonioctena quinquepunctata]|nr:hypothetical protein JTB14_030774 [Gonioctena quinquepunctata]
MNFKNNGGQFNNSTMKLLAPRIKEHYLKSHWALEEKYQEIMEELYIKIQNNQSIPRPTACRQCSHQSSVEWPTFFDLFTKVIRQNQSISKTGEVHYLKSQIDVIRRI